MKTKYCVLLGLALAAAGCGKATSRGEAETNQTPVTPMVTAPTAVTLPAKVARVVPVSDRSKVCMVNNQYMGREQIPVLVDEKTYYGCCPMCESKLRQNADVRSATDPVSSKPVDKATAIIGKTSSGDVLYFENDRNLALYAAN